jgi:hypothetical protein
MLQRQDLEVNNKKFLNEKAVARQGSRTGKLEQAHFVTGPGGQQQAATQ